MYTGVNLDLSHVVVSLGKGYLYPGVNNTNYQQKNTNSSNESIEKFKDPIKTKLQYTCVFLNLNFRNQF